MGKPTPLKDLKSKQKELEQKMKAEPESLVAQLECPPDLPPLARQEWEQIVADLIRLGILSRFDRIPLSIYCQSYALWVETNQAIQTYGAVVKSPNGFPVQSPYLTIRNRQEETMLRIAAEFGFTPASRIKKFPYTKSNSMLIVRDPEKDNDDGFGLQPLP